MRTNVLCSRRSRREEAAVISRKRVERDLCSPYRAESRLYLKRTVRGITYSRIIDDKYPEREIWGVWHWYGTSWSRL